MKKISEYKREEKQAIMDKVDAFASPISDPYFNEFREGTDKREVMDLFGMCGNCGYLEYCRTEFGKFHAGCSNFDITLKGGERIVDCTGFSKRGLMTLNDMKEIAYIIEVEKKKKAGLL